MICPKCGFSQPDDIYCVLCGVNIKRYGRKKKKRRYKAFILIALIGIAAISIAKYVNSIRHTETPQTVGKDDLDGSKTQAKGSTLIGAKAYPPEFGSQEYSRGKTDGRLRSESLREPLSPERPEDKRLSKDASSGTPRLNQQKAESHHEAEKETRTATQWFEKGKALDDDSEAEIECYKKAIELDPKFAPAYYRLGAIYYRQANYELADQEFSHFLKYASEADRETYDIYVYYSLADVERLSEEEVTESSPAEEAKKEAPSEAEKETVSEGEKETEKATGEEKGQETSEEVMTIVRFSPVEGHITVPVVLNGFLKAKVLVDTGAGITILSRGLAHDLGLEGELGHFIKLKTMAMDIQAQLARLDSIQVGSLTRNNFPVAIADLPLGEKKQFDGILGMDFMSHYKIHIDNESGVIAFAPKAE